MLLSAVDLIMVSSLGTMAIAAVSILGQPRMVILCVSRSFSVAITAHIAQKYGEKTKIRLLNLRDSLYFCPLLEEFFYAAFLYTSVNRFY